MNLSFGSEHAVQTKGMFNICLTRDDFLDLMPLRWWGGGTTALFCEIRGCILMLATQQGTKAPPLRCWAFSPPLRERFRRGPSFDHVHDDTTVPGSAAPGVPLLAIGSKHRMQKFGVKILFKLRVSIKISGFRRKKEPTVFVSDDWSRNLPMFSLV